MPEKKNLSLRLSDNLREAAKRCAMADNRTLTSWITNLIAREVASLAAAGPSVEQPAPPTARKSRGKAPA